MRFKNLSIKWKLMIACIGFVSVPVIIIGSLSYKTAENQINIMIEENLQKQSEIVMQNVKNTYALAQNEVNSNLKVAWNVLEEYGTPVISASNKMVLINEEKEQQIQSKVKSDLYIANTITYSAGDPEISTKKTITVDAQNQITKKISKIDIPLLTIGGQKIAFNYEIVDRVKETAGVETATIFQLIPQGLLRISTNVKKLDGSRAVGTYIPTDSKVYKTVMRKETFFGRAFVVNAWYKTAYEPIMDDQGQVIGVLYVGVKENRHVVNNNHEIVDQIQRELRGTATIFQLKAFEGEKTNDATSKDWTAKDAMYRVSTNVIKNDGSRAIDTIVSKPVYDVIMRGEVFLGRAWVVNAWYMTAYKPLKLKNGKICGILYVGVKENDYQEALKKQLAEITIGKSGYIYIINDKGDYILSHKRESDGVNIYDAQDANGVPFIQQIIERAKTLEEKQTAIQYYPWQNNNESQVRMKLDGFSYFPNWNWIIASSVAKDDFTEKLSAIRTVTIIVGLISIILIGIFSYLFTARITNSLNDQVELAKQISQGDLNAEIETDREDEIGALAKALKKMVQSLKNRAQLAQKISNGDLTAHVEILSDNDELGKALQKMRDNLIEMINKVKTGALSLGSSMTELSGISSEMANATTEMSSQSTTVAGASDQITTSISTMANNSSKMNVNVQSIAATSTQMSHNMSGISESMDKLAGSVNKVSEKSVNAQIVAEEAIKLSEQASEKINNLNVSANKIGEFSQVIKEIAQQTNLLALNANIEAASAGEAGKGFAVVANEVKELANQSSRSADDISSNINEIQKNTISSVESMEDISRIITTIDESTNTITEMSKVGAESIGAIVNNVKESAIGITEVSRLVSEVSNATDDSARMSEELKKGSGEISKNIQDLNRIVSETAGGITQIHQETKTLSTISEEMNLIVDQFKLAKSEA